MEAINIHDFNNHKIKEAEVIAKILAGEKELYEILIRRNNQKLYRVIRSYLKDEAEIEDIMQDTYIKAFTKLYQFKLESSFATWLIRIGINESLARIKQKGKIFNISNSRDFLNHNSILEIPDYRQLNPQDTLIRSEAKQVMENAIDQLDSKYRSVYIMREVEEMSIQEIALALDLSISNVKIRIHRSKEMLKEKLFTLTESKNIFEFGFGRCDRITDNVMRAI